jgi:hypothetical protein
MSTKMSIHRALADLKTLDSRINKAIAIFSPVGLKTKKGLINKVHREDDFVADAKSISQSVNDLIKYKTALKTAIVKSNAETMVTIEGVGEMSVADAITYKDSAQAHKQSLLMRLRRQLEEGESTMIQLNADVERKALEMATTALGKDNVKLGDDDVKRVTESYLENNCYEMIDPINIRSMIDALEAEVLAFDIEVDAVLSEANATTFIEV